MWEIETREEMVDEIYLPIKTVKEKLGYEMTMTRLPYLSDNKAALEVAKDLNLPVLGWGIENGRDWDTSVSPETITKAVLDSVCDGAVGCLHVRGNTCKALDVILPELKKRDYCLVTPEELFKIKGVTPPVGVPIHNINDFLK
jgi:peptidoglycan/xylan/chitin deacetylase (PgdA/CDA1 family)